MNAHVFERNIGNILRDNLYDREITKKRSGILDTKGLWRSPMSGKIFKRREERKHKLYDCTLLVDCSGSMSEGAGMGSLTLYQVASDCVVLLHKAFTRSGLPTRVVGFHGTHKEFIPFDKKCLNYKKTIEDEVHGMLGCTKKEPHFFIEKDTEDRLIINTGELWEKLEKIRKERSGIVPRIIFEGKEYSSSYGSHHNMDGQAVEFVVHEAQKRKGEHIIVVISDGQPTFPGEGEKLMSADGSFQSRSYFSLKKMVDRSIKEGILFVGIGLNFERIKNFYPEKFCSVLKVKDSRKNLTGHVVFDAVASQLSKHIVRG